jgi:hypothetical protein
VSYASGVRARVCICAFVCVRACVLRRAYPWLAVGGSREERKAVVLDVNVDVLREFPGGGAIATRRFTLCDSLTQPDCEGMQFLQCVAIRPHDQCTGHQLYLTGRYWRA